MRETDKAGCGFIGFLVLALLVVAAAVTVLK